MPSTIERGTRRCVVCGAVIQSGELCPVHQVEGEARLKELGEIAKYESVPVADLSVDDRYQRRTSVATLNKIKRQFSKLLLGTLTVSRRTSGQQVILDGQHRWQSLKDMGYASAPCEVFEGLSYEDEAFIFALRNRDRTTPHAAALFRAVAEAGNEEALLVQATCHTFGFTIAGREVAQHPDVLHAVNAIEQLHRGRVLGPTLTVVRKAWPSRIEATRGEMLMGIGTFLRSHPNVTAEELGEKLRQSDPGDIINRATAMRSVATVRSLWIHIYRALIDSYNYKRSSHRLTARDIRARSITHWAA